MKSSLRTRSLKYPQIHIQKLKYYCFRFLWNQLLNKLSPCKQAILSDFSVLDILPSPEVQRNLGVSHKLRKQSQTSNLPCTWSQLMFYGPGSLVQRGTSTPMVPSQKRHGILTLMSKPCVQVQPTMLPFPLCGPTTTGSTVREQSIGVHYTKISLEGSPLSPILPSLTSLPQYSGHFSIITSRSLGFHQRQGMTFPSGKLLLR